MRILVTGADGFAGRYLCELLRAAGDEAVEAHGPRAGSVSSDALSFDIVDEGRCGRRWRRRGRRG